jgi:bacterioferritin-associated ferredoxin
VYVCHCNALTDQHVRQAADCGARRAADVYRAAGCQVQCGGCTRSVVCMLREFLSASARPQALMEAGD